MRVKGLRLGEGAGYKVRLLEMHFPALRGGQFPFNFLSSHAETASNAITVLLIVRIRASTTYTKQNNCHHKDEKWNYSNLGMHLGMVNYMYKDDWVRKKSQYLSSIFLRPTQKAWTFFAACSVFLITFSKACSIRSDGINPLTAEWALRALIDFTLSNARRFYSSMGNPLDGKGFKLVKIWL